MEKIFGTEISTILTGISLLGSAFLFILGVAIKFTSRLTILLTEIEQMQKDIADFSSLVEKLIEQNKNVDVLENDLQNHIENSIAQWEKMDGSIRRLHDRIDELITEKD